jgi:hypothetical protein
MRESLKIDRTAWVGSTSHSVSLLVATLAGIWLDRQLADQSNWGTWSGILLLLVLVPLTVLLYIPMVGKVKKMKPMATKFTKPTIAEWCIALMAGALFGSAVYDLHIWWFGVLALSLDFLLVVSLMRTLKRVEKNIGSKV